MVNFLERIHIYEWCMEGPVAKVNTKKTCYNEIGVWPM